MLIVGIIGLLASFFIKFIPFINIYRTPIQIASVLLLAIGIYWKGGYSVEMDWRTKVEALEQQVKETEVKSTKTNTIIKKVYVNKIKIVKQDRIVLQERIKEVEKIIDKDCKVAPEAINLLNQSAKKPKVTVEVLPLIVDPIQGGTK